jgi:alkylation response protein AidB-like acyl-CoA dehydrogenase
MSWILDEQRRMLRDSAQSFIGERLPVAHGRQLRDSADPLGYSLDAWRAFGEQGYAATLLPEAFGGLGLGVCEAGLIAEQLGHTLAPTPFLGTAVLAGWLLSKAGSGTQQQAWLPRVAAAQVVLALAVDEGPKHRPQTLATTAVRDGDGWRLDGHKRFVVDGHGADALIVAAQAADGVALLLVPAGCARFALSSVCRWSTPTTPRESRWTVCAWVATRWSAASGRAARCWTVCSTSAARCWRRSWSDWPTRSSSARSPTCSSASSSAS